MVRATKEGMPIYRRPSLIAAIEAEHARHVAVSAVRRSSRIRTASLQMAFVRALAPVEDRPWLARAVQEEKS